MFPPEVIAVVRTVTTGTPDAKKAVKKAVSAVRAMPDFRQMIDRLVNQAVADLVHDLRHQDNRRIKNAAKVYDVRPAVDPLQSDVVQAVVSPYDFRIAGQTLGDLRGRDLIPLAETEEARARGHAENAALLRDLRPRVRDDQTVREAVSERLLRQRLDAIVANLTGAA